MSQNNQRVNLPAFPRMEELSMAQPHERTYHDSPPTTPRWVKVFGIIFIALVLLVVVLHLTGISHGGPGMHTMPMQHSVQQP